jgi:hypothetical protein
MNTMKKNKLLVLKSIFVAFSFSLLSLQMGFSQDAFTSVKINIQNLTMSADQKTISYDVYLQDVDDSNPVAVPGFLFRLAVPQADLGTNPKTVTVTNGSTELGASYAAMTTSGTNWLMKFASANLIVSYQTALLVSATFPGTRIGTLNITNTDGTAFANNQPFNATYSGSTAVLKTTITVFLTDQIAPAPNSSNPQPSTNFSGLGAYLLTVEKKPLTITGVTATNKVYDGTSSATLSGGILNGVTSGDVVKIVAGSGTFPDKNVGTTKTITANGFSLEGADAEKYVLSAQPNGITANITAATLTVTGVTASNKAYDRTATANLSGGSLSGIIGSDVVTLVAGTGTFSNKNVGTGKTITASGYGLSGTDAANYILVQPTGLTANITAVSVTLTGVTANNKVYNGTTTATFSGGIINGIISGDAVTIQNGTGVFDTKRVGTDKTVTASAFSLAGTDAPNYLLSAQPSGFSANITAAPITITNLTANKVYDGTTAAPLSGGTLSGKASGDDVSFVAGTGVFADKNVGLGKPLTVNGFSISGTDASNYIFSQPSGVTANITAASVSINGVTASNKVYDGTPVASLSGGNLTGVLGTDAITIVAGTGAFADKKANPGKTVTASGYSIGGNEATNYSLSAQPTGMVADITVAPLTITGVVASNKAYDGTRTATLSGGTLVGVKVGDIVTIVPGNGTFADKNIGTNISVSATGYSINGADASNYILSAQPSGLTASITASSTALTITGVVASDKTYDGTTVATLIGGTLVGVAAGDDVTLVAGTGSFNTKNVGIGKTVIASGYYLSGNQAVNYTLTQPSGITARISAAPLSISAPTVTLSKVYDGNTSAAVAAGSLTGVVPTDSTKVTVAATATYDNPIVGSNKTITISYFLYGTEATNYSVPSSSSVQTGVITPATTIVKLLSVSSPTITLRKEYDGTTNAEVIAGTLSGVESQDAGNVTLNTSANYYDASAGVGKAITVRYSLSGSAADKYTIAAEQTYSGGEIVRKQLSVSNVSVICSKNHDGNTMAVVSSHGELHGVLSVDTEKISLKTFAYYDNADIGSNKTITLTYSLSGEAKGNYFEPEDSIISNASITAFIELGQIETPTVTALDSGIVLSFKILEGSPSQYKLTFDSAAIDAGIANIDFTDLPSSDTNQKLSFIIPSGMKYGVYHATFVLRDSTGNESAAITFSFTVNVSADYIIQLYPDVISFDNSCQIFATYQWYKDGIPIVGATKQFYSDNTGLNGSYSLKMTTLDGQVLYTYAKIIVGTSFKYLSVYPNPVKPNQTLTVEVSGFDSQELENSTITIYSTQGVLVYQLSNVETLNLLSLPLQPQLYIGHMRMSNGSDYVFNIIVE